MKIHVTTGWRVPLEMYSPIVSTETSTSPNHLLGPGSAGTTDTPVFLGRENRCLTTKTGPGLSSCRHGTTGGSVGLSRSISVARFG